MKPQTSTDLYLAYSGEIPKGTAVWAFELKGRKGSTVSFITQTAMSFTCALGLAITEARNTNSHTIVVLP
jgi:hypothetical protein